MKYFLLFLAFSAQATTYYVDFDAGDDTAAGTSTGTAWRTIPGYRNTADSGYYRSTWGTGGTLVSTGAKVPSGSTFMLKPGTTLSTNDGGSYLFINSTYYSENAAGTYYTFKPDTNWASGQVIIDGIGQVSPPSYSVIEVQVNGVKFDGVVVDGMIVRRAPQSGIKWGSLGASTPTTNGWVQYMRFETNGTQNASDLAGAGSGALSFNYVSNAIVLNCNFDGGSNYVHGVLVGNNHTGTIGGVTNCYAWNHKGDVASDDSGHGFKAINSQMTYYNCHAWQNMKGWDCGEVLGDARNLMYKILNCTAASNTYGINMNHIGSSSGTAASANFYVINCYVYGNSYEGSQFYDPPFNAYFVHNVYADNGGGARGNGQTGHISGGAGGASCTNAMGMYLYNNLFIRGYVWSTMCTYAYANTNTITWDSDYNCYQKATTASYFCRWGIYGGNLTTDYTHGSNGPGYSSGNWYTNKSSNLTGYNNSTSGHLNSDSHSIGTSATDTTLPTFYYDNGRDFRLRVAGPQGVNLSGKSWYISEMGTDRLGVARSTWRMGAVENLYPNSVARGLIQ